MGIILIICFITNQDSVCTWNITSRNWWKGVYSDGGYVISSPLRWDRGDWLKCGFVLGTTGGIMTQDEELQGWVKKKRTPASDKITPFIEPFGTEGAIIALGAVYLTGCLKQDTTLKRVVLLCGESALISGIIVGTLKIIIGRARPDKGKGAWDYCPLNIHSYNQSIPSGHTSTAFSIATCLADESRNPLIAGICYLGATAVGLARIHDNWHWASDVFLGGIIGISVGKTVVKLRRKNDKKNSIN